MFIAISIETERLCLEPISKKFVTKRYLEWLNDPDVYKFLVSKGNYTLRKLKKYINQITKKEVLMWAIIFKENQIHVGNIKMDPINFSNNSVELGIMIGDKNFWGMGIATETIFAVAKYCFTKLDFEVITLGVEKENLSAIRAYSKIGFIEDSLSTNNDNTIQKLKKNQNIRMLLTKEQFCNNW